MTIQDIIDILIAQIKSLTITYVSSDGTYVISAEFEGYSSAFRLRGDRVPSISSDDIALIRDRLIIDWALKRFIRY